MSDKEIIKAIELCIQTSLYANQCSECPYAKKGNYCMNEMFGNALDLIKRQQAKIEELEAKHWGECMQIAHYDNESKQFADIGKLYSEIKSEAIKKFVEALKAELKNLSKVNLFGNTFSLVGESFVDKFVERYEKGE